MTARGRLAGAVLVTAVVLAVVFAHDASSGSGRDTVHALPRAPTTSHATGPTSPRPATTTAKATPTPTPAAVPRTAAGVPIAVTRAVAAAGAPISVAVYDATTGTTWSYQDHGGQVEASVSKLSILGATLQAEQRGAARPSSVVAAERRMIGASDNSAASALYVRVGQDGLEDYDEAVGAGDVVPNTHGQFGLDLCTAADQVKIMRGLAYHNAVLTDASRAQAAALLATVEPDQRWGATGGVPASVTVQVKNGWLPHGVGWVVNTVGHVSGGGHDYVVAIMSQASATEQAGIDRVEKVSAAVWATAGTA